MENSPDETPWHCSDIYIFGKMETFSRRLNKVNNYKNKVTGELAIFLNSIF